MAELRDGDLAEVDDGERVELARFRDNHCGPTSDCDPQCCRYWAYFGSDITAYADEVSVVRRVRVVDCE